MRKVLIFIGSLTGGGAERVTVALARHLLNSGYAVTLVTTHGSERDFFTPPPGISRVSLGLAGRNRGVKKLLANVKRLRALRRVIKTETPDVVVGMMTNSAVLCILACMGLPARSVVSERNFPGRKASRESWALLRRIVYRFADAHVAQTVRGARWLEENTGARNIHVIANSVAWPVPVCEPEVVPNSVLSEARKVILAVGSKPEQKGLDLLLDAFARVSDNCPDWQLVILGMNQGDETQASLSKTLLRRVQKLGVADQVSILGRVGNMSDWYERADLFVLSSRYEGFPNVLLEAMAAGTACIAFDCETGPRDIIEQHVDGVLVDAENVEALSNAIEHLVSNDILRKRIGSAAMRVRSTFSENRVFAEWENVFSGVDPNHHSEDRREQRKT